MSQLKIWPEGPMLETLENSKDLSATADLLFKICQSHLVKEIQHVLKSSELQKFIQHGEVKFENVRSYLEHRMDDRNIGHYF